MHISQALSGVLQKFKSLRSSVWHWLALEKEPRSIAPQEAELCPFKEGNHLWNFSKFCENCSSVFKHMFLRPGQESQNRGSRIALILACCQHINSLTAVLNIKDLVLGHHPILVLLKSKGRGINKICNVSMFSFQNLCLCFVISGVRVIEFLEKTVPN